MELLAGSALLPVRETKLSESKFPSSECFSQKKQLRNETVQHPRAILEAELKMKKGKQL